MRGVGGIAEAVLPLVDADDRVEGIGPGRGNGNFVLGEIELQAAPKAAPDKFAKIKFGFSTHIATGRIARYQNWFDVFRNSGLKSKERSQRSCWQSRSRRRPAS